MPKMKTHKGATKRFKVTGTGKVRRYKAFKSHILTKKTSKRKRRLRQAGLIATTGDTKRMKRLLQFVRSERFSTIVATLPGYSAEGAGSVLAAFPQTEKATAPRT